MRIRLILALLVAAIANLNHPLIAASKGWKAMKALLGILRGENTASEEMVAKRLAVCRNCEIFYAPLQTCGSPLEKSKRGLGCYCQLEFKARDANAECWLDSELDRDSLNGWRASGVAPGFAA